MKKMCYKMNWLQNQHFSVKKDVMVGSAFQKLTLLIDRLIIVGCLSQYFISMMPEARLFSSQKYHF